MTTLRFTPMLRASDASRQISRMNSELDKLRTAATTGLEVQKPSDAPGRWPGILDLQGTLADQDFYQANATRAESLLTTAETALQEGTNVMTRATEIALAMSNETFNDLDRAQAAEEVDGLREQLLQLANTNLDDRYVFAGEAYDAPAYDDAGVYQGTANQPESNVGEITTTFTGLVGSDIFDDSLAALESLSTALRSGPGSALATTAVLPTLETAQDVIITTRTDLGLEIDLNRDARTIAENLELTLQGALDAEIAADPFETFSRLAELQETFQAALAVQGQSFGPNLFEYMR